MKIYTTYAVKLKESHGFLRETVIQYRRAVAFFLHAAMEEWETLETVQAPLEKQRALEALTHRTRKNPNAKYDFDKHFHKFPSYLRRAAITDAIGKITVYQSRLLLWKEEQERIKKEGGKAKVPNPGRPTAGFSYPVMYRGNCYIRTGDYTASLKIYNKNKTAWDWLDVEFKKTDADYILRHCAERKECAPTLRRRGKNWYLDFAFEEKVELGEKPVAEQTAVGVDLGLHNDCACVVMKPDGTILGRRILSLSKEKDSLKHALNRIKKAQQHGAKRKPRLWARAKGISGDLAKKTAQFIADLAAEYQADVIVLPYLDLTGKKTGPRKQAVHHWKLRTIQRIITDKAHRMGMKVRRTCPYQASALAFDGSGKVKKKKGCRSICIFPSGKEYHSDLSASYNLTARYFIREIMETLPPALKTEMETKIPDISRRTACTLSTLRELNRELISSDGDTGAV